MPSTMKISVTPELVTIRVSARATLKLCNSLKDISEEIFSNDYAQLCLDLSECEYMDSTFMGTLTKLELGTRKSSTKTKMVLLNTSSANRFLLEGLGLKDFFVFKEEENPSLKTWVDVDIDLEKKPDKNLIIEVHEALMDVDSTNIRRFKDLVNLLKKE